MALKNYLKPSRIFLALAVFFAWLFFWWILRSTGNLLNVIGAFPDGLVLIAAPSILVYTFYEFGNFKPTRLKMLLALGGLFIAVSYFLMYNSYNNPQWDFYIILFFATIAGFFYLIYSFVQSQKGFFGFNKPKLASILICSFILFFVSVNVGISSGIAEIKTPHFRNSLFIMQKTTAYFGFSLFNLTSFIFLIVVIPSYITLSLVYYWKGLNKKPSLPLLFFVILILYPFPVFYKSCPTVPQDLTGSDSVHCMSLFTLTNLPSIFIGFDVVHLPAQRIKEYTPFIGSNNSYFPIAVAISLLLTLLTKKIYFKHI